MKPETDKVSTVTERSKDTDGEERGKEARTLAQAFPGALREPPAPPKQ